MSNRIAMAVERMEKQIVDRIAQGLTTVDAVEATRKALDMDFDEYVKFQELKSLAVATGKLSTDEGMAIYAYLGTIPDTFNGQSAAVKSVLTKLFAELLKARIGSKA